MRKLLNCFVVLIFVFAAMSFMVTGCGNDEDESKSDEKEEVALSGRITISGSTTVLPLAQEAVVQFEEENPDVRADVQGGGSSTGITQVSEGVVDIGMSSRELKSEEKGLGLIGHKIALDVICVIGHPEITVNDLTKDQVKSIFTGEITNWKEVGGEDAEIVVVVRDQASGTRECFDEQALDKEEPVENAIECNSNGIVRETVSNTRNAVGYVSLGYINDTIKVIDFEGVTPKLETAKSGDYKLSRYLYMFTKGTPEAVTQAYIDFCLSPKFQKDVVAKEYIPMTD